MDDITRLRQECARSDRHEHDGCSCSDEELAVRRIAEIDAKFDEATGWGSWMVMLANEREALATRFGLQQKNQARTASGGRVD